MRHMRTSSGATKVVRRKGQLNLRAYPSLPGPEVPQEVMTNEIFASTLDARREDRRRFGRSISMDVIESALRNAYRGSMRNITDILRETIETDPHLGSILNKRFGSVANLPWDVQPAVGTGVDRDKAMFYAEVCRQQLRNMKTLRKNIGQLAWALFDGRACLELQWVELAGGIGASDSRYGMTSLAIEEMDWIHPRRISFGPERELRIQPENVTTAGNFSASGLDVRDLPDKFVWWTPQLFGEYPEREGLGIRVMYWSFFKRFAARERMVLAELFGKPWRIVTVDEESNAGDTELKAAEEIVDALGNTYTARMPRGTNLQVVSPQKNAGQVHSEIIAESDKQNSKLVLGQTGTTDAVPAGLNSNQANVMQDEQLGVLIHDASELSEVIEKFITNRMIAVNFGESEVTHAPVFKLRADLPADRVAELTRLDAALNAGLSVSRAEAYELSGFSIPDPDEVTIQMQQPPTPANAPVAPAIRPMVVYPVGASPDVGEQQPPAREAGEDVATESEGSPAGAASADSTVTVNEDRASRGLDILMLPEGGPDPRGDLTVKQFNETFEVGAEGAADGEPAGSEPAKQAMNGAQITAVLDIVERFNTGALSPASAEALLVTIFPFSPEQASAILGPAPDASAQPTAAAPVGASPALVDVVAPDDDDDEEEDAEPLVQDAGETTQFGLSRIALGPGDAENVAIEISEGEVLYGEAGIHAHEAFRALEQTGIDGAHAHVFQMPNGLFVATELDGVHQHRLAGVDADETMEDGAHGHAIILAGLVAFTGEEASPHTHILQVQATAVDGAHRHTLLVPNPDNTSEMLTLTSLSAGEFAAAMREGTMPSMIEDVIPGATAVKRRKRKVYGEASGVQASIFAATGAQAFSCALALASERHVGEISEWNDWVAAGHPVDVQLALGQDQPGTVNGSPEDYVVKGMRELTGATAVWAKMFEKAVANQTSAVGIFAALQQANSTAAVDTFGRALERRKLQSFMLGVLDNMREITGDADAGEETIEAVVEKSDELGTTVDELQAETSAQLDDLENEGQLLATQCREATVMLADGEDFTKMPFKRAVQFFKGLSVLDKAAFERAQAAIKQRSFTVAGIMRDQMLRTLQNELVNAIQEGDDLRKFSSRIAPRLKDAGFLGQIGTLKTGAKALNASHVETVFRTNVLNTYNTGRYVHQSSPTVMAAFPVWEFRALPPTDPHDRKTHFAANGKMLMANDPFWARAYPPYGFNCRCRVVARSRKFLTKVVPGTSIRGLPDPGFTSGRPALALG